MKQPNPSSTTPAAPSPRTVLVTGATGYIGGRLVPRLLEQGHHVRCLARDARKLEARTWIDHPNVKVVEADAADDARVAEAMRGCDAAYYLIHSMISAGDQYRERDRDLARGFARAAESAGVDRIIYLGGLGETGAGLSRHLKSRREVEECLAETSVPLTVLRAAMIIGSASASFETMRYLAERLPVMITPKWVRTESQPISAQDTLRYLVTCLDTPETVGRTLDIGGPDILSYQDILQEIARALGLRKRLILPVPILTPKLSALWIHLITPVSASIARPLADGLRNRVVCRDDEAHRLMPGERLTVAQAIDAALSPEQPESSWLDAGVIPGDPDWAGGKTFVDRRTIQVQAVSQEVYGAVCRLGGRNGWFQSDWLWRLRGAMDKLLGGPGLARGRRHPDEVNYGDVLDFWRVAEVEPGRRLVLRAEMKLPGEATLEFLLEPDTSGQTRLTQTAKFRPRGMVGLLYWFVVSPLHGVVFQDMLHGIRDGAEARTRPPAPGWAASH